MATKKIEENVNTEVVETENTETETPEVVETPQIPEVMANNPIFADFCKQYLSIFTEISEYNKAVLAPRADGWTSTKIFNAAKEMGRPEDANKPVNEEVKSLLVAYENAMEALTFAKKDLITKAAEVLGIPVGNTQERDATVEEPRKEKRTKANVIGTQLKSIADMLSDENISSGVLDFLNKYPLPAVGRDQARNFTSDSDSTPKYRTNVEISRDGEVLATESGFTKAALALTKPMFGYERGKSPKANDFRTIWEKAGNSANATPTPTVTFEDNGLTFTITKK